MFRKSWKTVLFVMVVASVLLAAVDSANAWWWGWGGCRAGCGWGGGWGAYYSPCGWGCYRPYRWCGGWCGGCGWSTCCSTCYCGCYSGCYDVLTPCCGSTVVTGAPTAPAAPTPAKKPVMEAPSPTPAAPAPGEPGPMPTPPPPTEPAPTPSTMYSPTPETSGVVTVWVPYDAKVTVNGLATRSTGSRRQFVSYGLKPGFSYKYEIRAEVVRGGKTEEDTRTVILTAGMNTAVAFGFNTNPAESLASAQ
jgi:uncharacterized protein (TIGR03000 family)